MNKQKIRNADELEFAVFCVENVAIKTGKNPEEIYDLLTKKTDILGQYIIPEYDVLHTQSKEYIVEEILDVMRERGIDI